MPNLRSISNRRRNQNTVPNLPRLPHGTQYREFSIERRPNIHPEAQVPGTQHQPPPDDDDEDKDDGYDSDDDSSDTPLRKKRNPRSSRRDSDPDGNVNTAQPIELDADNDDGVVALNTTEQEEPAIPTAALSNIGESTADTDDSAEIDEQAPLKATRRLCKPKSIAGQKRKGASESNETKELETKELKRARRG